MGDRIWWGEETDQRFEDVVQSCEADIQVHFDHDATIDFGTIQPKDEPDAGLFWPDTGIINLYANRCLDATALCHELLHRYFWYHTGKNCGAGYDCLGGKHAWDPDYNHTRPEWKLLPGTRYCPPDLYP